MNLGRKNQHVEWSGRGFLATLSQPVVRRTGQPQQPVSQLTRADLGIYYENMKLVFIYESPASGKLTVTAELSRVTGFRLFHNQVSIQFVQSLFEFATETFQRLTDKYRLEMLEEAARFSSQ